MPELRLHERVQLALTGYAKRPGQCVLGVSLPIIGGGPHPMVARNGEHVAERLAETSLYRRDLDLAVRDGDAVVGYALFGADPVTGVGLVEPMRIEASHQGRGLARVLLETRASIAWPLPAAPASR